MKIRSISITLIGLCIIGGLTAGLFSRSIEAALTLPLSVKTNPSTNRGSTMPMGTAKPSAPTPSTANERTILAQDTFHRANQVFWRTASDGRQWVGDANSIEVFSVAGGAGQADHAQGTFNAILGPINNNLEVIFSGLVNQFTQNRIVNMQRILPWSY